MIGKTAQLEFYDLEADLAAPSIERRRAAFSRAASLYALLAPVQAQVEATSPAHWYLFKNKRKSRRPGDLDRQSCARRRT